MVRIPARKDFKVRKKVRQLLLSLTLLETLKIRRLRLVTQMTKHLEAIALSTKTANLSNIALPKRRPLQKTKPLTISTMIRFLTRIRTLNRIWEMAISMGLMMMICTGVRIRYE
jgi:hypothetical protein